LRLSGSRREEVALQREARGAFGTELAFATRIKTAARFWLVRKEVNMKQFKYWESLLTALLGVWLMVSPWLLKFAETAVARDNAVLTGVLVLVASLWALARENDWAIPSRDKVAS
jgi:hypothetical protein